MKKAKTERVVLAEYSCYELDCSLDSIITQLTVYRTEALRKGLVDVRLDTDWHDEPTYAYGGYDGTSEKVWTISVVADKLTPAVFKTKLPKAEYNNILQQGLKAYQDGWERKSPYNGGRGDEPWFEGFDSVKEVN